jgi:catechol 2,3-dioxygenase-like lactoylglutathione lyase family enzyme
MEDRMRLHHVQLAIPPGSEPDCCKFYAGLLCWTELEKPEALRSRRGAWFATGDGELHLGVEADFRPARKAHPAFAVSDLDALAEQLLAAGAPVEFDDAIPGLRRFYTADPVGNRIEFLEGQ